MTIAPSIALEGVEAATDVNQTLEVYRTQVKIMNV
jgi:hypothetical protein